MAARRALLVMFLPFALQGISASAANASPLAARFGDSTWVAPAGSFDPEFTSVAPRVALPDHERRWETALRTPFRVVFFPLRLVAGGLEAAAGYFGPRYLEPKAEAPPKSGLSLSPHFAFGSVSDIGVGPAVRWVGFPAAGSTLLLTGSWSAIDRRRAHFSETIGPESRVGFQLSADYDRKPNRRYYGIGNDSPESELSYYLLENTSAEAALRLGASPRRRLKIAGGYSNASPGRGSHGSPLLHDVNAPGDATFGQRATAALWYGVAADLAMLDDGRDPSRGIHGRADVRRASGIRSGDPDYDQWRLEGRAYVPVFAKRRVIALRGVYAGVEPRGGSATILPYYRLMQSVGGSRFAGYASERFRDRQLMLGRVEYRWTIVQRVSAVALYELGAVAPSVRAFHLRGAHRSYGGGLRLGQSDERALRFELAKSDEGLQAVLSMGSGF